MGATSIIDTAELDRLRAERDAAEALVVKSTALFEEVKEVLEDVWLQFAYEGKHNGKPTKFAGGLSTLEEVESLRPKIDLALKALAKGGD